MSGITGHLDDGDDVPLHSDDDLLMAVIMFGVLLDAPGLAVHG